MYSTKLFHCGTGRNFTCLTETKNLGSSNKSKSWEVQDPQLTLLILKSCKNTVTSAQSVLGSKSVFYVLIISCTPMQVGKMEYTGNSQISKQDTK